MASRANTASPANSAMAIVTQITAAIGSSRALAVTSRGVKTGMLRDVPSHDGACALGASPA